mmetsp:Transcript_23941/g.27719  ORF Transcript_23941/g.27719 Transcript_23941/m.27719 type:complete len:88 (+) Transcript_23941:1365-1628(+)
MLGLGPPQSLHRSTSDPKRNEQIPALIPPVNLFFSKPSETKTWLKIQHIVVVNIPIFYKTYLNYSDDQAKKVLFQKTHFHKGVIVST